MTLKDLLRKKSVIESSSNPSSPSHTTANGVSAGPPEDPPEFKFYRTTTMDQEEIQPPTYPSDTEPDPKRRHGHGQTLSPLKESKESPEKVRRPSIFKRSASSSSQRSMKEKKEDAQAAQTELDPSASSPVRPSNQRKVSERLSQRLRGLSRSSSRASADGASSNLPDDLGAAPAAIPAPASPQRKKRADEVDPNEKAEKVKREAQWEERATKLALRSKPSNSSFDAQEAPVTAPLPVLPKLNFQSDSRPPTAPETPLTVPAQNADTTTPSEEKLHLAIHLHETGDLEKSTALFATLADGTSPSSTLAQVLYGLALRHGWGITPNAPLALHYLRMAASSAAEIESAALNKSLNGGSAKGELVLAIFELANCYRYQWGVDKDPVAARAYYETAANLGDVDACEEVAWCYMEGFGGEKDKWVAAQYLRLAEERGRKIVGGSWIWKDKYDPDRGESKKKVKKDQKK
ncbi:hypothetical protein MBLNU457_1620t1 [Dothideomycetes sp. NU457]